MKKNIRSVFFLLFVLLVLALSIWGPEALAKYKDRGILFDIHAEAVEEEGEGYRYALNNNEKIYILSKCLNSLAEPEGEQNALNTEGSGEAEYQEPGSYAFVINRRGPSGKEITDEEIYETCNSSISTLKELGILPEELISVEAASYDAVLYSAIDVLEPRNNVSVWKVSLSNSQKNANKENRLIDLYIDGDSGKVYEFYARTGWKWEDIDPDEIMQKWSDYLGLGEPVPYETENPLLESTPHYKKYMFEGMAGEKTIATVGFYEGINELFIKISK